MRVDDEPQWSAADLKAILGHQLEASLAAELERLETSSAGDDDAPTPTTLPCTGTFADLFEASRPPVELLERVKRYAKRAGSQADGPLPDEVATVLYLAAIVTARLKCAQSISRLDESTLRSGVHWALDQPWLAPAIRELFARACDALPTAPPEEEADA
jgi:hypothetical protein